ncbi:hypothetical protein EHZ47_02410 [Aeromonas jandaei]|uniref:hypothetical protein n=1 Tax=Aeromonas jandaei TaxID=650 RepID=UPI000F53C1AB|nr:hypothetical protein [Aeromonas jandaei]RQM78021.1 hypothetical protein EHZ47_02410 [Aeromonas jandaei]
MSKGIKMEFARKNDSGDTLFHISKLHKNDNGNLNCRYCGTSVQYVSAYKKRASKTPVSAYLKLWQDSEHAVGCGYSVKGAVDQLVADSNAVETTNPIFEHQSNGSYIFRMNILLDAQRVAQSLSDEGGNHDPSVHLSTHKNYIRSEQQLASYFRSAAGIAKIRSLIQDSEGAEELKGLVKIQFRDGFIDWNDFYYDDSRYHILYKRLVGSRIPHPIAVNLTLKGEVAHSIHAKKFNWSFQCYSQIKDLDGKKTVYIPRLYMAKESFTKSIAGDNTLLVVGNAWANELKDEKSIFRNFSISIFNQSQFKKEINKE